MPDKWSCLVEDEAILATTHAARKSSVPIPCFVDSMVLLGRYWREQARISHGHVSCSICFVESRLFFLGEADR
ncbi:hypothetical protein WT49_26655 [Burkholderia territorii]|nr:hypothetical protein WS79_30095 [Burkholderia territorii]KVL27549.1 hypothetical protein WS97_28565 [Burkholderia territorii]KVT78113.1 hypothetical protein WT25_21825 [Burkholderia territorii]KWA29391.1 hypothetical protein WT39_10190 [Burkholderia territorii]KWE28607.1 hypothetical protein WT49_26655 [Burkholderia territorii]